jgi:hypothetical protein
MHVPVSTDKIHCTKDSSFLRHGDNRFRVLITSLPKAIVVLDTIAHCFYNSPQIITSPNGMMVDFIRDPLGEEHRPKVLALSGALLLLLLYRSSRKRSTTATPIVLISGDDSNSGAYPPDSPTDGPIDKQSIVDDDIPSDAPIDKQSIEDDDSPTDGPIYRSTNSPTTFLHPMYSLTQRLYKRTSQYQYRPGHLTAWVFYLGIIPFLFRPSDTGGPIVTGGGFVPTSLLETPSYLPSSSGISSSGSSSGSSSSTSSSSTSSSSSSSSLWGDSIRGWIVAFISTADQRSRSSLASVRTKASLFYPKAKVGLSTINSHLQALHTRVRIKTNGYYEASFRELSSRSLPALEPYLTHVSKVIEQNPLLKAELYNQQVSKLRGVYTATPDNLKGLYSLILLVPLLLLKKIVLRPKTPTKWSPDWVRRKPRRWN